MDDPPPCGRRPGWRIPAAVIGVVVLLALAGFLVALSAVSSDANHEAGRLFTQTAGSGR
jgi:hypothetical protein